MMRAEHTRGVHDERGNDADLTLLSPDWSEIHRCGMLPIPQRSSEGDYWWLSTDGLVVEYGEDALSRYDDVSFSPGARKPDNMVSLRLFATKYRPAQFEVFALDEALGGGA